MLRVIAVAAAAVTIAAIVVVGHSGTSAAEPQTERFTTYVAPTGPELAPSQAQDVAVRAARVAGQTGALTLSTVHASFGHAHALLMGETSAQAEESGLGERAEEMRSSVWVTSMTAQPGQSFTPTAPVPRRHTGPSGAVMVVVSDAHTGFVKEEYVGPSAPSISSLGAPVLARVAAEPQSATTARRRSAVAPGQDKGWISGVVLPARAGLKVTLTKANGARLATTKTLKGGNGARAGSFSFRERVGRYLLTAPRCHRLAVSVLRHRTSHATLHCSA